MEKIEGFKSNTFVYKDQAGFLWICTKIMERARYYNCFYTDCKSKCIERDGSIVVRGVHSHILDPKKEDYLRFLASLRHLAATTNDNFKDIFTTCQIEHEDGALQAGSLRDHKHILQLARSGSNVIPKTLLELDKEMQKFE